MADRWEAKGHVAKILRFDEATLLFPLNENEARRLLNLVQRSYNILEGSRDFPEKEEYQNLIQNLHSAYWLLMDKFNAPSKDTKKL